MGVPPQLQHHLKDIQHHVMLPCDKSLPPNSSEEAATRQPHQDLNNSASSDEPPSSMQNQQHPSPEFPPGRQHQLPPHPPTSHEAAAEAEPVKVFIKAEPEKMGRKGRARRGGQGVYESKGAQRHTATT
eukprot:scaffold33279_cov19-Tisochrysis_lutea.AAC.1